MRLESFYENDEGGSKMLTMIEQNKIISFKQCGLKLRYTVTRLNITRAIMINFLKINYHWGSIECPSALTPRQKKIKKLCG